MVTPEARNKIELIRRRLAGYDGKRNLIDRFTKRQSLKAKDGYGFSLFFQYPNDPKPTPAAQRVYGLSLFDEYANQILQMVPLPALFIYVEYDSIEPKAKQIEKQVISLTADEVIAGQIDTDLGGIRYPDNTPAQPAQPQTFAAKVAAQGIETPADVEQRIRAELQSAHEKMKLEARVNELEKEVQNLQELLDESEAENEEFRKKTNDSSMLGNLVQDISPVIQLFRNGGLQGIMQPQNPQAPGLQPEPVTQVPDDNPQLERIKRFVAKLNPNEMAEFMYMLSMCEGDPKLIFHLSHELKGGTA